MGCRSSHGQDVTLASRYIIETPGHGIGDPRDSVVAANSKKIKKRYKYREIVVDLSELRLVKRLLMRVNIASLQLLQL